MLRFGLNRYLDQIKVIIDERILSACIIFDIRANSLSVQLYPLHFILNLIRST